jgi:phage terminase large subunit-like protein
VGVDRYPLTPEGQFDLTSYLAQFDPRLLADPEGRRILTRLDPILHGLVYLPHHLRATETGNKISFSTAHIDWAELALRYVKPIGDLEPGALRDAIVAFRGAGKSTWWFTIIPMWLAAHGHRLFLAAFANSATQAEGHLATFKRELQHNQLLRRDFSDLCTPARKPKGGAVADSQSMYMAKSGFVFAAKGIDSSVLGLKVGTRRPDHIILDDVEGTEGNYSSTMKDARLKTITSGVLPMNNRASVTMAGTVAMPGAIIDDVAAKQRGDQYPEWVDDENFVPRYYDIIRQNDDGTEESMWPERYPMSWIETVRHTRSFQSQMRNDPRASDSPYFRGEDFAYESFPVTHQILSIDPAVTAKEKSDYTALVVVGFNRPEQRCLIRDAWQVRIPPGEPLRNKVLEILDAYPQIAGIVIETNQGGDTWKAILHDMPCPVRTVHQTEPKEVRAGSLLNKYQRRRVFHEKRIPVLESQMIRFPNDAHDDLLDATGTGVTVFLKDDKKPPKANQPRSIDYV